MLRYLISFRQHNEFHEQCVERFYYNLQQCKPHTTRRTGYQPI
ncbi:hypothetical protein [Paraglaciecola sp. MB-3u-78]